MTVLAESHAGGLGWRKGGEYMWRSDVDRYLNLATACMAFPDIIRSSPEFQRLTQLPILYIAQQRIISTLTCFF